MRAFQVVPPGLDVAAHGARQGAHAVAVGARVAELPMYRPLTDVRTQKYLDALPLDGVATLPCGR